ncbi:head decoration protein [Chromobacterium vaccinii]|uniref:head decoration protein n=1 Tax=Chromobacterium vaccinii TaxID=1108595 RepID=UPI003C72CA5C
MTMIAKNQAPRAGEFLLSKVGNISMDVVRLAAGPALPAGQLLAQNPDTTEFEPYDAAKAKARPAAAVLYAPQPERSTAENAGAVARLAEVIGAQLTGLDAAATVALKALLIVVR